MNDKSARKEFIIAVIGRNFFFLCLNMEEKNPYTIVSCHVIQDASTQVKGKICMNLDRYIRVPWVFSHKSS